MLRLVAVKWFVLAVGAAAIAGACSGSSGGSPSPAGGSATAGPSASRPATTEADYWTGTITYRFAGGATGPDVDNLTVSGTYNDTATYAVVLSRDNPTSSGVSWSVVSGNAIGSVHEDLGETDLSGGSWRMTLNGGGSGSVPAGACKLTFAADGLSYAIECGSVSFGPVEYVGYEGGTIEEGPRTVTCGPPEFSLKGLAMPSSSVALSGSRKADVFVDTAGSKPIAVKADVSWSLAPRNGPTPTAPPVTE